MLQTLISGILIGGVYSMVAVGLNLIFGVMNIVNFAQGEFLMLGMMASYLLYELVPSTSGARSYVWVLPSMVLVAAFGLLIYKFLIRKIADREPAVQILITVGLSFVLQGAAQVFLGSAFRSIPGGMQTSALYFQSLSVPIGPLIAFLVSLFVTGLLTWAIRHTWWGRAVRALAEKPGIAPFMGINRDVIFGTAFVVGIALAALAGALLMPYNFFYPTVGSDYVVIAFLVVVIAGLGNIAESIIGGLLLGVVESLTATYVSADFSLAAIYVIFLLVLALRPQGLFTIRRRQV